MTTILDGRRTAGKRQLAALQDALVQAGADAAGVNELLAGLTALPSSFQYETEGSTKNTALHAVDPTAKGYKRAAGYVENFSYQGPRFDKNTVVEPGHLTRGLIVQVSQLPLGRYHVSVTTGANDAPVELGTFKVRLGALISPAISLNPTGFLPTGSRYGSANFGYEASQKPVPAGLSLPDVTTVIITDDQGAVRLTGSMADAASSQRTHSLSLHLTPAATQPAVGGTLSLTDERGEDGTNRAIYLGRSFLLQAVGLPANAALTLTINGAAVQTVTTGPTGKLFVKAGASVFPKPPARGEVVNELPDTLDLSAAKSFALTDTPGNVLATANLPAPTTPTR